MNRKINIAIDGPAGAGKSTIAKLLSDKLGISYIDTGAIYRAYTWKIMETRTSLNDIPAILSVLNTSKLDIYYDENGVFRVRMDGRDINNEIRSPEVTENIAGFAAIAEVRDVLVKEQQELVRKSKNGVIMDGRDIGTVVMPFADYKFFLDASIEKRAERRIHDLNKKGFKNEFEIIKQTIKERDKTDSTRKVGALRKAEDAIYIDTTELSINDVVDKIITIINGEQR